MIPYDMQAPVAVRCLWTNCYTLPLPLPFTLKNLKKPKTLNFFPKKLRFFSSPAAVVVMDSSVFRISEGGGRRDAEVVGCGGGVWAVPPPQKNNNFGGILTRFFISYRCNNRVQIPFSVPYDLLRVFEDDNTTI